MVQDQGIFVRIIVEIRNFLIGEQIVVQNIEINPAAYLTTVVIISEGVLITSENKTLDSIIETSLQLIIPIIIREDKQVGARGYSHGVQVTVNYEHVLVRGYLVQVLAVKKQNSRIRKKDYYSVYRDCNIV